jgi:hypothetical protein
MAPSVTLSPRNAMRVKPAGFSRVRVRSRRPSPLYTCHGGQPTASTLTT